MTTPRILFAGTPEFARVSLAALIDADLPPVAVLTQPDRPAGRGRKLTPSPVRELAARNGIPVLTPRTLRDESIVRELDALHPDLMVVAAYGLILPQAVLDVPRRGCVNVHASLLPRWRGAAPIQAAILAGDEDTGACLMQMGPGLDDGPVHACRKLAIGKRETAGELHDRIARAGAELLLEKLPGILAGSASPVPQDAAGATHAPKISAADARLDWQRPAAALDRVVRAFNPVPGAYFMLGEERIKCWQAQPGPAAAAAPGTIVAAGHAAVVVACGEGTLHMTSLQRPGKRRVSAAEFSTQLDLPGRRL